MQKRKSDLCIIVLMFSIGTLCILSFNYYEDLIKPKKMSFSEMQLYNNELIINNIFGYAFITYGYHFSIERNLYIIFYIIGVAILLEYLGFWNIEKIINKHTIKQKIKKDLFNK